MTLPASHVPEEDAVPNRVFLHRSHLVVELRSAAGTDYLDVRSRVDRRQGFLLPLRAVPLCGGLSLFSRLGRLHAEYWSMAYGQRLDGDLPVVRFEKVPAPGARFAEVSALPIGDRWWVADATGLFGRVALRREERDLARTELADRW